MLTNGCLPVEGETDGHCCAAPGTWAQGTGSIRSCASTSSSELQDDVPYLPPDIWGVVLQKLSVRELAKVARVNKGWRLEAMRWAAQKRAVAVSRVTAPVGAPDSQLTRPQLVLRIIQRLLLHHHPFTGEPMSFNDPNASDCFHSFESSDAPDFAVRMKSPKLRLPEYVEIYFCMVVPYEDGCPSEGQTYVGIVLKPQAPNSETYRCTELRFGLHPRGADDFVWMQGLLWALTGGFQGLFRGSRHSSMPGGLAHCSEFSVTWFRTCTDSEEGIWPVPINVAHPARSRCHYFFPECETDIQDFQA